jgi:hypothetical protein
LSNWSLTWNAVDFIPSDPLAGISPIPRPGTDAGESGDARFSSRFIVEVAERMNDGERVVDGGELRDPVELLAVRMDFFSASPCRRP